MRKQYNKTYPISNQTIIGSLLIGTALGAATAFLLSKKGKHFRDSVIETCTDLSEEAKNIAGQIAEKSIDVSHDISDKLFNGTKPRTNEQMNWIIGGIGVAILGIVATAYFSQGPELRDKILHTFQTVTDKTSKIAGNLKESVHDVTNNLDENLSTWVNTAQEFLEVVNGYAKDAVKEVPSTKNIEESSLGKVMDLADCGIKLYKHLVKK